MEIRQLMYFKKVAEVEHITKAAESMYISQPTLSLAIRRLENELGVSLFDRKGRNVRLNEYGRIFYDEVKPAMEHLEAATRKLAELQSNNDNKVTIMAPSLYVYPGMMEKIYEMYPNIHISRINSNDVSHVDDISYMLMNREIDMCITMASISGNGIERIPLRMEPMMVLVSEDHPLAANDSVSLEELANEKFVADMVGTPVRTSMDALCEQIGFVPDIAYETRSDKDIHLGVASGKYVAIVPSVFDSGIGIKGVKGLTISYPHGKSVISLYHLKDVKEKKIVTALVRVIKDYFIEHFGTMQEQEKQAASHSSAHIEQ